jgi:hypothetical protein
MVTMVAIMIVELAPPGRGAPPVVWLFYGRFSSRGPRMDQ